MSEWRGIAEAHAVTLGTVADLLMHNGRVYRATWASNGRCVAWWPDDSRRKSLIPLYAPKAFRVVAVGIVPDKYRDRREAVGF